MPSVKTRERRDIYVIHGKFKWKKKNKRATMTISFKGENRVVAGGKKKGGGELWFCDIFLEREKRLSKIPGDPTVEILREKKEGCSIQRGLRVGSGFK